MAEKKDETVQIPEDADFQRQPGDDPFEDADDDVPQTTGVIE